MKALIHIQVRNAVMLIGLAGGGKTQACNGMLKELDPEAFTSHAINMNFYTDSTLLQSMMEIPLEKKAGRLYAPSGKLHMIYFIDDLNMPALDPYNTQTAIELMRQKQDYNHWYDRAKITVKDIGNTSYLCCMNPTAGSFIINPRLQRHFWTAAVPFPEQSALTTIYTTFMKGTKWSVVVLQKVLHLRWADFSVSYWSVCAQLLMLPRYCMRSVVDVVVQKNLGSSSRFVIGSPPGGVPEWYVSERTVGG